MYIWPSKKKKNRDVNKKLSTLLRFTEYYSETELFKKISAWGIKIGAEILYFALILFYVLTDEKTSLKNKLIIMGALGYFILPTDLISDFIPVLGFTDDAAFLSFAVMSISDSITPEIKEKAKEKLKELINESIEPEQLTKLLEKTVKEKNQ